MMNMKKEPNGVGLPGRNERHISFVTQSWQV